MGGLVSRLMVTDSNLLLWNSYFAKPPEEVPIDPETKKFVESLLIFHHRPEVSRVIFISTPHRGSEIASNWIGSLETVVAEIPRTAATELCLTGVPTWRELNRNESYRQIMALTKTRRGSRKYAEYCLAWSPLRKRLGRKRGLKSRQYKVNHITRPPSESAR